MKILFAVGVGIHPEQRVERWKMVSELYAQLGKAFTQLGHQTYFYVHPEASTDSIPKDRGWFCEDHSHFDYVLEKQGSDFVFCWNGSSPGDVITSTIANSYGAKMIYSEQGWFPQKESIYFDFKGCNGKCSTRNHKYPRLLDDQRADFLEQRKSYIKKVGGTELFDIDSLIFAEVDSSKPIFVPLQDENDLNIVQDSPFKSMDAFIGFLSKTYPNSNFLVRPHPKFSNPALSTYSNVTLDDPKKPMFASLSKCGLVVGINSTTLLESALLGYQVVAFGQGLATGTGLFHDADFDNPPKDLATIAVDREDAEALLFYLLCVRQMWRADLNKSNVLMRSWVFKEMIKNLSWNNINR